jgi:hypothetical protein
VLAEHQPAIEIPLAVAERIAGADVRVLDRLHEGDARVAVEFAEAAPQELPVADLVVGVARLDRRDLGEAAVEHRQRRVQVARFRVARSIGRAVARRLVVEDRRVGVSIAQARGHLGDRLGVCVVADHQAQLLPRPVLL